ncbi:MAG: hypothetical protein AAGC96_13755, partial [Pseudomonadota bacterium]
MQRIQNLRDVSIGRWLKIILAIQVIVAVVLIAGDFQARWLPTFDSDRGLPSGPISPGDQVRRYDPGEGTPGYTKPSATPDIDLPSEMPDRLEFSQHTVPEFGEVMLVNGTINAGDAERFAAHLDDAGAMDFIALNSPGGVVEEALSIGRLAREREVNTVILAGMSCVSACPYILAGGLERSVSLDGAVGMHQHYYDANSLLPAFLAVRDVQYG